MAKTTKAQRWAQRRNHGKFRLRGAIAAVGILSDVEYTTQPEKQELDKAMQHLRWVLEKWETQNAASKARTLMEGK